MRTIHPVTGNVLRDYNTDLFPPRFRARPRRCCLVVPLMVRAVGLFETALAGLFRSTAGVGRNHLRWDSLGEFLDG